MLAFNTQFAHKVHNRMSYQRHHKCRYYINQHIAKIPAYQKDNCHYSNPHYISGQPVGITLITHIASKNVCQIYRINQNKEFSALQYMSKEKSYELFFDRCFHFVLYLCVT